MANSSTTNDLAKQLVADLGTQISAVYTLENSITRVYTNQVRLEALTKLNIFVIPRGRKTEIFTRGEKEKTHSIEIGFQKHVESDAEADTLSYVVEATQDWLIGHNMSFTNTSETKTIEATCLGAESILADNSIFSKEHLGDDSVFTSVLVCQFLQTSEAAIALDEITVTAEDETPAPDCTGTFIKTTQTLNDEFVYSSGTYFLFYQTNDWYISEQAGSIDGPAWLCETKLGTYTPNEYAVGNVVAE